MESISVIVTAHDCAGTIRPTLQSVADALAHFQAGGRAPSARTPPPGGGGEGLEVRTAEAEVVVVDDGSTDGTAAVVEDFLGARAGWRLVRRADPSSPSCARNTGARHARGGLLCFLDGDDLFLPNHLAECWEALRDPDVDYVKTGVRLAHPVHADWRRRIEFSLPINLCVRRRCHDSLGGFPDYLLCRRTEDGLRPETDVFFKFEDMFYNRLLRGLFRGRAVAAQTVEYCRHPGNSYDRQYEKFGRPPGAHPEVHTAEENYRLQLAEVIIRHRLSQVRRPPPAPAAEAPATAAQALAAARRHHQAGDLARAEQLYRLAVRDEPANAQARYLLGAALQAAGRPADAAEALREALAHDPRHAGAHLHLGVAQAAQGQYLEAAESFRRALELRPDSAEAHHNLGLAWRELGRLAEAEGEIGEALRLRPDFAEAHHSRGTVLAAQGKREEATACYREALRLKPDLGKARQALSLAMRAQGKTAAVTALCREAVRSLPGSAEAHADLGRALLAEGRKEEAVGFLREALRLRPDWAEVHNDLGQTLAELDRFGEAATYLRNAIRLNPDFAAAHSNLGALLRRQGRNEEALVSCREGVRLAPGSPEAHNNLGLALLDGDQLADGEAALRQALRLNPGFAAAHNNLGIAHWRGGRLEEARACYEEALRLRPEFAEAVNNLGNTLRDLGGLDEAQALFDRALGLNPDYVDAHWNRSLLRLLRGDFARGWPEYEWRWRLPTLPERPFPQPRWDGAPPQGRTILLHAEQGLGDTFQFVRYARLVKQRGGKVILACPPALLRLLAGCPGVDHLVAQGSPLPPFDCHAPLLSLPGIIGTDLNSIPADVPYLRADPALVEHWRGRLADLSGYKVGIAWQGSDRNRTDLRRSIPLQAFEALTRVAGVRLVNLQKGPGAEQASALAGRFPVAELPGLDEAHGPFMDTAAVLHCLDLVICCDTALGHLAGALGVPCWLALMAVPDWRWLLGRDDSPWYPRHRLYRQDRPGDWDRVFRRIAEDLEMRVSWKCG